MTVLVCLKLFGSIVVAVMFCYLVSVVLALLYCLCLSNYFAGLLFVCLVGDCSSVVLMFLCVFKFAMLFTLYVWLGAFCVNWLAGWFCYLVLMYGCLWF